MVFLKGRMNRVSTIVLILILIASSALVVFSNNGTNYPGPKINPSGTPISQYSKGQSLYNVSFLETGLLYEMGWKVNLSGDVERSFGPVISFSEPNGTYQYGIANVSGYSSSLNVGTITVNGFNITQNVVFTNLYNKITFTESGLYSGSSWGVILNGTTERSSNSTITFLLPNGIYNYNVLPVSGMNIVQPSGTVSVSGSDVDIAVQFTSSFYDVSFLATGLPSGLSWSVNLNNTVVSSTASTIVFLEQSGTYNYTVSNVSGFFAIPSTGKVVVNGVTVNNGNVEVEINFVKSYYSLAFSETSLPAGMTWSVYVYNSTLKLNIGQSSSSNTITFNLPNGSFRYSVVTEQGYAAVPPSGTINVSGSSTAITIVFEQGYYTIQFRETGLDTGTPWQVVVKSTSTPSNNIVESSDNSSILFSLPAGGYNYSAENLTGYTVSGTGTITVSNANEIVNLVYSSSYYKVTFTETGLPSGTEWGVNLNSISEHSSTNVITFLLPNGIYNYNVLPVSGMNIVQPSGTVSVSGSDVDIAVQFTSSFYDVSFLATGLPSGLSWSVNLNNTVVSSTASTIVFLEQSGTYNYTVSNVSGFFAIPSTGKVVVNGVTVNNGNVEVEINFVKSYYSLAFSETSLPAGMTWSVYVYNSTLKLNIGQSSSSNTITFNLPNGSFRYSVVTEQGYAAVPPSGTINVSGSSTAITIVFEQGYYTIQFRETGLDTGTPWQVVVKSTSTPSNNIVESSDNSSILFSLPAGGYNYSAENLTGYTVSGTGTITVSNANEIVNLVYSSSYYKVTFTETGLPSGTEWNIVVSSSGTSLSLNESSYNNTITYYLIDGIYNFKVINESGFVNTPVGEKFIVQGAYINQPVFFSSKYFPVYFNESGLLPSTQWAIKLNNTIERSQGKQVTFQMKDGIYNFSVIPVSGFVLLNPLPPTTITVNGVSYQNISFKNTTELTNVSIGKKYTVYFNETGLVAGSNWQVLVNQSKTQVFNSSQDSGTVRFSLRNGTYYYKILDPSSYYSVSNSSGYFNVSGTYQTINTTFLTNVNSVSFTETGLPSGTDWSVVASGTNISTAASSSGTGTVTLLLPNGTYFFEFIQVGNYTSNPHFEYININRTFEQSITFTPSIYQVGFKEKGLPSGTDWSVVVNGAIYSSGGTGSVFLELQNGTYYYYISPIAGYNDTNSSGVMTISGNSFHIQTTFTNIVYRLEFTETGLSPGSSWSVTVGSKVYTSDFSNMTIHLVNGTYHYYINLQYGYTATNASGFLNITGSDIALRTTFKSDLSTIQFHETGLPSGTVWVVTINGTTYSSSNGIIANHLLNGTYEYFVAVPYGYAATNSSGFIYMQGTPVFVNVTFMSDLHKIQFTETGLPSGTDWSVVASGTNISTAASSSGTGTVTLLLPNGTYFFEFIQVGNYTSNPHFEYININRTFEQSITFTPSIYQVGFKEKGLPSGTDWSVVVNGAIYSSGGTGSVFLELQNGTYYYYISPIAGYNDTNSSGVMTISGNSFHIQTTFTNIVYRLEFTETGLSPGSSWSVTVGSKVYTSDFSNMTIHLVNGTYHYYINLQYGYTATNASGFLNITGSDIALRTTFKSDLSTIQFHETGLPSGTVWVVTINGTTYSSSNGIIANHLLNGTYEYFVAVPYGYAATNSSGFIYMQGTPVFVNVTFMSDLHKIQFTETGLPSGTDWSVSINGTIYTSSGSGTISVNLPNGTYLYVIMAVSTYYVSSPFGTAYLDGGILSIQATFYNVQYNLEITESGLPSGLEWGVSYIYNQGSNHLITVSNSENIQVVNGTYILWFSLSNSSKFNYYPEPLEVIIYINGNNRNFLVHYSDFVYNISLLQKGLPTNTNWSINFNGLVVLSNHSNYINMTLQNGTYSFTVNDYNAYYPINATQAIFVHGVNEVITVAYNISLYRVTFAENGLSVGSEWNLSLKGLYNSSSATYSTSSVNFELTNGTYLYTVTSVNKTYMAPPSGTFTLSGSPKTIYLNFTEVTYNVTFKESGLPSNTRWSINLDGNIMSTNNTTITEYLSNGTYDYSISEITGYHITSTSYGNFTVSGKSVLTDVTYTKNQTTPTPPPPQPTPPAKKPFSLPFYFYEVLIIVIIAGVGIGVTIYTQQKKKMNK
jgi:hypothetical protein